MLGTVVNTLSIIGGALLGLLFRKGFPDKIKLTVIQGIGLAVILIGGKMAAQTQNPLIIISSLVVGGAIGELIDIEKRLANLGRWIESRFSTADKSGDFTKAFVSTSLIYCVGAMAIMGSLESGLRGNHQILYAKSMLDGVSAVVFASSMGIGVGVSAIPVFLYQGTITISAELLQGILSPSVIAEMSAAGGLLIIGIGLNTLQIKEIKVGNLLPAIFAAVLFTYLFQHLGIG